jgi:hypothetical protein
MPDSRYGLLQVCLLRLAQLEANGEPSVGADNGFITESAITVDLGIELSDDVDLEKQNGCGDICQTYFKQGQIKRATADLALCELDIQIAAMTVGGDLFLSTTTPIGWQVPKSNDTPGNGVCLEFWARAWDATQQAAPAVLGGDNAWWHFVLPLYKAQLDDMTVENDFLEFALTGFSTENAQMPAAGPFGDWPADIETAGGVNSALGLFLDTNLPSASGYIAVTDGAS